MLIQLLALLACVAASMGQTAEQLDQSERAKALMAAGQFGEAVPLYGALVAAMPDNVGLRLNLAMAHHMARQDRQAVAQFRKVLATQPQTFPALAMMGASLMRLGEPEPATAPLRTALQLQPGNQDIRRILADAALAAQRYSLAEEEFKKLATAEPQNPDAWYGLGKSYEALAAGSFSQLAKIAQGSAWWLALIAESRVRNKQNSSAFYFYRQALARNPKLRGAHAALAEIYRGAGRGDWAEIETAKERSLPDPECAKPSALCQYKAAQYDQVVSGTRLSTAPEPPYWRTKALNALAVQAFQQLDRLGPSVPLHRFVAEQHRSAGRFSEAITEPEKARNLQPANVVLEQELAMTVYTGGDFAKAEELLRKLVRQQPGAAELQFLLGDSLVQQQRIDEGILALKEAVRLNAQLAPAHAALSRALMQAGRPAEALIHLQKATALDDDGSLHYQLMRAAQASGKTVIAEAALKKYKSLQQATAEAKEQLKQQADITAPPPQ